MIYTILLVMSLLTFGILCRLHITSFRYFYVPASVLAGALGLALVQLPKLLPVPTWAHLEPLAAQMGSWPGVLIAVVFAALLLERESVATSGQFLRVGRQVLMVWIIVLGQTAVGLWVTWLIVQPYYDVPNSFAMLIETGFAGGHGTAAAMGQVFSHPTIQFPEGLDLGILMATVGLIYGIGSGILWINIGLRLGWIGASNLPVSDKTVTETSAEETKHVRRAIGYDVLDREVIDPLLLQIIWLTFAFAIGIFLQTIVVTGAEYVDGWLPRETSVSVAEQELEKRLTVAAVVSSFPLFIFTLFGGWIVRRTLQLLHADHWIDRVTIRRLSTVAMEVLVVAAITSLNIQAVAKMIVPISALMIAGCIWTPICLLFLSRYILPKDRWFSLGLINYGMSTGTTATGMVLLRLIDPELRSGAAQDYALAAPFSAPFIGGGMLTVAIPLVVLEQVPIGISAVVASSVVGLLIAMGIWIGKGQGQALQQ